MRKEPLRKLRTLNATPAIIRRAKEPLLQEKDGWKSIKRNYAMFLRCQHLGRYLKIAVFLPADIQMGKTEPRFEIFINPEGEEFITRILKDGKETGWSQAKIENLPYTENGWEYLYHSLRYSWINPEGGKTIERVLGVPSGGYKGILRYQNRIRTNKIQEKERKEKAPWDADMALLPKVSDSFNKWMVKEVIQENFIFYEYKKNVKEGYCSYCRDIVPAEGARHQKYGRCKKCGKEIVYKSTGKIKTLSTDTYNCQLLQLIPGGFVLRKFRCSRSYTYDRDYRKPKHYIHEYKRLLYRSGKIDAYEWGLYKGKESRWIPYDRSYIYKEGPVYPRTIPAVKRKIRQTGLFRMLERYPTISIEGYLRAEQSNPAIEKLVKLDCTRLPRELIEYDSCLLNKGATELTKILRLDRARLKRLREADGNTTYLEWLQTEKTADTIYPQRLFDYFSLWEIAPRNLDFIADKMTYEQICNYLIRQQAGTMNADKLLTTWRDYLNMAERMKMDLDQEMIYKPKDLNHAHAELILALQKGKIKVQADQRRKQFPAAEAVLKTLSKYEYEDQDYCIQVPSCIEDIIREGMVLNHCVHTCDFYFDRISRQETYLLFLRRTESRDTPWYTLEAEPSGNIRQKRTTGDNLNKDIEAAYPFLKKWQKEIQKRLSKEDRELGKKSNELRRQEYAKLKKDGNRIWHGVLQGKLLADVLEADFMEFDNAG